MGLRSLLSRLFGRGPTRLDIFPFHDGTRRRWIDPLAVYQGLDEHGGNWMGLLSELSVEAAMEGKSLSPELAAEMGRAPQIVAELADVVRKVFGVKPLGADDRGRPEGLTGVQCLQLLTDYLNWLRETEGDFLPLSKPSRAESPSHPTGSPDDTGESVTADSSPSGVPASASD